MNFQKAFLKLYREKLNAEINGRPFRPPPPSSVQKSSKEASVSEEWEDWGTKQPKQVIAVFENVGYERRQIWRFRDLRRLQMSMRSHLWTAKTLSSIEKWR